MKHCKFLQLSYFGSQQSRTTLIGVLVFSTLDGVAVAEGYVSCVILVHRTTLAISIYLINVTGLIFLHRVIQSYELTNA